MCVFLLMMCGCWVDEKCEKSVQRKVKKVKLAVPLLFRTAFPLFPLQVILLFQTSNFTFNFSMEVWDLISLATVANLDWMAFHISIMILVIPNHTFNPHKNAICVWNIRIFKKSWQEFEQFTITMDAIQTWTSHEIPTDSIFKIRSVMSNELPMQFMCTLGNEVGVYSCDKKCEKSEVGGSPFLEDSVSPFWGKAPCKPLLLSVICCVHVGELFSDCRRMLTIIQFESSLFGH